MFCTLSVYEGPHSPVILLLGPGALVCSRLSCVFLLCVICVTVPVVMPSDSGLAAPLERIIPGTTQASVTVRLSQNCIARHILLHAV